MCRLVVNADDFGLSEEVNAAVVLGLRQGFLSDTSILVMAPFAPRGVEDLLRLGVTHAGIHLDLDGPLCWSPGGGERYPRTELKRMLEQGDLAHACEEAARRQIEAFFATGMAPSHLDTHHHVHGFRPVFDLVVRLALEYGIPALRFSRGGYRLPTRQDIPLQPEEALAMEEALTRAGIFHCDRMAEGAGLIFGFMDEPPEGTTELVVHPSLGGDPWRARELDALERAARGRPLRGPGFVLTSFRDLVGLE